MLDHAAHSPPAAPRPAGGSPPLLVVVRDVADLDGALQDAAGRARAGNRTLLVAVVSPPVPLTTHPLVHALCAELRADVAAAVAAAATRGRKGLDVRVLSVRMPRGLTRNRARRALDRRLDALVRRRGAERHPEWDPLEPTAPDADLELAEIAR